MDGAMDIQGGRISTGSPGGDGGWDEHAGSSPGVRSAPGHRALNAGLFGPPGYSRQSPPKKPKLSPYTGVIGRILEDDLRRPRRQRHTAKRIFERLRDEYGFDGGYTTVKDYVRENRRQTREMFVPLSHAPGHAQWDFGEALVVIGGAEQKAHCFVIDLPHSDGCFVKAYPAETTEAFLDGHVSAFAFLGGVPQGILYDNTRLAMAKILGDGRRKRTRAFTELQSHYLFKDRFGRPARATTRARWRAWWGTCGATPWCRCRPSRASMRSIPNWSGDAWNEWTPSSGTYGDHRSTHGAGHGCIAAPA